MEMEMVNWVGWRNMESKSELPLFNFELIADTVQDFLANSLHFFENAWIIDMKCVFNMSFGDD